MDMLIDDIMIGCSMDAQVLGGARKVPGARGRALALMVILRLHLLTILEKHVLAT